MLKRNIFGILSIAMTPLAVVFAILAALIVETTPLAPALKPYLPTLTRVIVLTTASMIGSGLIAGLIAFAKREQPRWLPAAGLTITVLTVIVFHFTAVGPNGD